MRVVVVYLPQLVQNRQEFEACNENHSSASVLFLINLTTNSNCLFHLVFCLRELENDESEKDMEQAKIVDELFQLNYQYETIEAVFEWWRFMLNRFVHLPFVYIKNFFRGKARLLSSQSRGDEEAAP